MTVLASRLVSTEDVAALLDCTVATVNRKCRKGDLPGVKFGHRWYINADRLEEMFDPKASA